MQTHASTRGKPRTKEKRPECTTDAVQQVIVYRKYRLHRSAIRRDDRAKTSSHYTIFLRSLVYLYKSTIIRRCSYFRLPFLESNHPFKFLHDSVEWDRSWWCFFFLLALARLLSKYALRTRIVYLLLFCFFLFLNQLQHLFQQDFTDRCAGKEKSRLKCKTKNRSKQRELHEI